MNKLNSIKKEISAFLNKNFSDREYFCIIYGSYASKAYNENSDLDLMVFLDRIDEQDVLITKEFINELHRKNNLTHDEEVPYENKLLVSFNQLEDSISLKQFKQKEGYFIPLIKKTKEELSSENIKLRLCLNAITSLNLFVCGDKKKYLEYKKSAFKALIKLITETNSTLNLTPPEITSALFLDKKRNLFGEDYLGYKDKGKMREHITSEITKALRS